MSNSGEDIEKALKIREKSTPAVPNESLMAHNLRTHMENEDKQPHLRDYLEVLLRRRWIVIIFLISVVTTVTIATFLMKSIYKASSTIQIKDRSPRIVDFKEVYGDRLSSGDYYETQYKILKSRNLAERITRRLSIDKKFELPAKSVIQSVLHSMNAIIPANKRDNNEKVRKTDGKSIPVGALLNRLEIEPVKKSQLVKINFLSPDPVFSADVANTVADEYIKFTRESKIDPTIEAKKRLKKEIEVVRIKFESSEKKFNEFISKSKFLVLRKEKEYENLLTNKLSKLSQELDKAVGVRIEKKIIYNETKKSGVDYDFVLNNSIIQSLTVEQMRKEHEYNNKLKIQKPEYPKMRSLKEEIETIKGQIDKEKQKYIDKLASDYKMALKTEKSLSSSIEKLRRQVNALQQKMVQFRVLKREVEMNNEMYTSLLKRHKEIGVSTALTETNVQILDKAEVPVSPFKPKKAFNIALSLFFGLFGGVFLAFFVEYFDNTLKSDSDVERISNLPVLGRVPLVERDSKKLIGVESDKNIAFSEAFRSISTCIKFSSASKPPKQILVTSPLEREGKTLLSVSIAMRLISSREKGVIIDADMRRPDVHTLFDLDNSTGLSSFLAGITEFDGLIRKSQYAGLDVITSGPIPPNPSELLNSSRMKELIDALSATYDHVIIDSPPVLGMSDSLILSTFTDGVILVVKAGQTHGDAFTQTNRALQSVNAKILGTVLNGVNITSRYGSSSYYTSSYLKDRKA